MRFGGSCWSRHGGGSEFQGIPGRRAICRSAVRRSDRLFLEPSDAVCDSTVILTTTLSNVAAQAARRVAVPRSTARRSASEVESHCDRPRNSRLILTRKHRELIIDDQLLAQEASKRDHSRGAHSGRSHVKSGSSATKSRDLLWSESSQAPEGSPTRGVIRFAPLVRKSQRASSGLPEGPSDSAQSKVFLKSPPIIRADIPTAGAFAKGRRAHHARGIQRFPLPVLKASGTTVKQVLAKYDGKIRFVYRTFQSTACCPQARGLEAARCAGSRASSGSSTTRSATGSDATGPTCSCTPSGWDSAPKFEACRSTRKYQAPVQTDIAQGTKLGVNGTPGFFINGRFLSGAQPLDEFSKIIDEELALRGKAGS